MTEQLKFSIKNGKVASEPQPIMVSWTNPSSSNNTKLMEEHHIKQEDELQIYTQVIKEIPHPCLSQSGKLSVTDESTTSHKSPEQVMKKFVKILPKNHNNALSQKVKEDYLRMPKRKYSKRHSKSPYDLIKELSGEEAQKKNEVPKEKSFKILKVSNVPVLDPVMISPHPVNISLNTVPSVEHKSLIDKKLIKKEEDLDVVTEIKSVAINYTGSSDPVIKEEAEEVVTIKVTNLDGLVCKKPIKMNVEEKLMLSMKVKSSIQNIKSSSVKFIKTIDKFGKIKLTTVPMSHPGNDKTKPLNFKLVPIPSGNCSINPSKASSIKKASELNTESDDEDEKRLVIKEEELEIINVSNENSVNFYNSQPSTSSHSNKQRSISEEPANPPKNIKLTQQKSVDIIPYIPKAKPPSRKSSSSSMENITSLTYPFQCKLCTNVFKRKIDMIHHVKSHSDAKFQCQRCKMKFKFEGYFQKHKCIVCEMCEETFVLKQLLRNHQRNVHGVAMRLYDCDICGKSLRYRYGILYHMSKMHMSLEAKFGCDICGKKFKLKESMRLHMKNHVMVIECKICGKKVKQGNLKIHIKSVHATERNYQCKLCSMTFKTRESLKSHVRTHEKSFECLECGKKFANRTHLKEHKEWHKNPQAFMCKTCNKSFSKRYCLKAHIKLHDSGHSFFKLKCTMCSYSTDKADNFKKHEMKHKRKEENQELRKNWVQCEKCPVKMKNKLKLATHYWKRHSEVMVN